MSYTGQVMVIDYIIHPVMISWSLNVHIVHTLKTLNQIYTKLYSKLYTKLHTKLYTKLPELSLKFVGVLANLCLSALARIVLGSCGLHGLGCLLIGVPPGDLRRDCRCQELLRMCRKRVENVSRMCRECVGNVSGMCRECVENVSWMCRKCFENVA